MFTLPNTSTPPVMNISSSHQLLHIFISHPQVESRSRACSLLRRAAPDATDAPAPAGPRRRPRRAGPHRRPDAADRAGGRRVKAVCALLVHTSPSDATPPLHPQILYVSLSRIRYPVVTVNVKCPPLDDSTEVGRFNRVRRVGLASPLLLRLPVQASIDARGRCARASRPRNGMNNCSH